MSNNMIEEADAPFKSYMIDGQVVKVEDEPLEVFVTKDDNTTGFVETYIHTFPDGSLEVLPKPDDSKLIK